MKKNHFTIRICTAFHTIEETTPLEETAEREEEEEKVGVEKSTPPGELQRKTALVGDDERNETTWREVAHECSSPHPLDRLCFLFEVSRPLLLEKVVVAESIVMERLHLNDEMEVDTTATMTVPQRCHEWRRKSLKKKKRKRKKRSLDIEEILIALIAAIVRPSQKEAFRMAKTPLGIHHIVFVIFQVGVVTVVEVQIATKERVVGTITYHRLLLPPPPPPPLRFENDERKRIETTWAENMGSVQLPTFIMNIEVGKRVVDSERKEEWQDSDFTLLLPPHRFT